MQPEQFSIWTALLVGLIYFSIDWLYCVYTITITERAAIKAANSGAVIYMINAVGILSYLKNPWYILFVGIGGWLGTYLAVKYSKKK